MEDITGDGVPDTAIGDKYDAGVDYRNGAVYIVSGIPEYNDAESADAVLLGMGKGDAFGYSVAGVGDTDGDGQRDLLVGSPFLAQDEGSQGAAYLFAGPLAGSRASLSATLVALGVGDQAMAGIAVAGPGDVNGDGLTDLLIGAKYAGRERGGGAYLVRGGRSGGLRLSSADLVVASDSATGGEVGVALAGSDWDGDGLRELLIGGPHVDLGGNLAGAVYIVSGLIVGTAVLSDADTTLIGESELDYAGGSLAGSSDLNGDGLEDVAIGAFTADRAAEDGGAVYVVFGGSPSGRLGPDSAVVLETEVAHSFLGASVAMAGDVDADGTPDLLAGLSVYDGVAQSGGAVWVAYGPFDGVRRVSDDDAFVEGTHQMGYLGYAEAGSADFDGDLQDDVVVTAPFHDSSWLSYGFAYWLTGGPQ